MPRQTDYATRVLRTAEAQVRAKVAANVDAARQAPALVRQCEDARDDAMTKVEELESAAMALEDVSPIELATARAAVSVADLRLKGAQRKGQRASQQRLTLDDERAKMLAPVVRHAMPGVPVLSTFVDPTEAPKPGELPLVVITQRTPSEQLRGGAVQGELTVRYYFETIHRGWDRAAVEAAGKEFDLRVSCRRESDMSGGQAIRVDVAGAPGEPIIPRVEDRDRHAVATRFAAELVQRLDYAGHDVQHDPHSRLYVGTGLVAVVGTSQLAEAIEGHTRRLTVETSVLVEPRGERVLTQLDQSVEQVAARVATGFIAGLGRVESFEVVPASEAGWLLAPREAAAVMREATRGLPMNRETGAEAFRPQVRQVPIRAVLVSSAGATRPQVA